MAAAIQKRRTCNAFTTTAWGSRTPLRSDVNSGFTFDRARSLPALVQDHATHSGRFFEKRPFATTSTIAMIPPRESKLKTEDSPASCSPADRPHGAINFTSPAAHAPPEIREAKVNQYGKVSEAH